MKFLPDDLYFGMERWGARGSVAMRWSRLTSVLGVYAAFALSGVSIAATTEPSERVDVVVKTSDLDLHTAGGAKLAALRIRNAAAEACGRDVFPVAVRISDGFIRCRESAVDRAAERLNAPLVADALGRSPQILSRND